MNDTHRRLLTDPNLHHAKQELEQELLEYLGKVRDALHKALAPQYAARYPSYDWQRGKISKGNYHEGLPWQVLDYPRWGAAGGDGFFLQRVVILWGDNLAMHWLLKGSPARALRHRMEPHTLPDNFRLETAAQRMWQWKLPAATSSRAEQQSLAFAGEASAPFRLSSYLVDFSLPEAQLPPVEQFVHRANQFWQIFADAPAASRSDRLF